MPKKILIFLSLGVILALIGGFLYWYFIIYQKLTPFEEIVEPPEKLEAKKILEEWLPNVLKPEFLPLELDIELGVDVGGGVALDKNTWGYNWQYLGKNFYTAIDYYNEKPGINAYVLAVFWDEKIDLDEGVALGLLENYFNLPMLDLKCETIETEGKVINSCLGIWEDEKEDWHRISIASGPMREINYTFLRYYLILSENKTCGEKP